MEKIIHVKLNEPYLGERDFFFGSLSAIFDKFTPEIIGATRRELFDKRVAQKERFITSKCVIERRVLIRKPQTNKNK